MGGTECKSSENRNGALAYLKSVNQLATTELYVSSLSDMLEVKRRWLEEIGRQKDLLEERAANAALSAYAIASDDAELGTVLATKDNLERRLEIYDERTKIDIELLEAYIEKVSEWMDESLTEFSEAKALCDSYNLPRTTRWLKGTIKLFYGIW